MKALPTDEKSRVIIGEIIGEMLPGICPNGNK